MIEAYRGFFAASAGASAAFIGLLFVALSFIDDERTSQQVKNWRRILASSSFSQLANIFFVSLAGLLPGAHAVALTGCIMAVLGLTVSVRLLPRTVNQQRTGRTTPTLLGVAATGVYVLQLVSGLLLLQQRGSQAAWDCFILAIMLLYAGALARAWEITGVKNQ